MAAALAEWSESWEYWGLEPLVMIDMGNRLLGLGRFKARGLTSGIKVDEEYAQLITLRAGTGMVMQEHDFIDWELGLLAAGFQPGRSAGLLGDLRRTARQQRTLSPVDPRLDQLGASKGRYSGFDSISSIL
jgi:hypothetical protein